MKVEPRYLCKLRLFKLSEEETELNIYVKHIHDLYRKH